MTCAHGADLQRQKDKRVLEEDPGRVSLCGKSDAEDGGQGQDINPDERRTVEDAAVKRSDVLQDQIRSQIMRPTLGVGIQHKLERQYTLDAERLEGIAEPAGR